MQAFPLAASLQLLFISPYSAFWTALSGMLFGMVYWADWLEVRRRLKVCSSVLPRRLQSPNRSYAAMATQVPNIYLSCCTHAMQSHGMHSQGQSVPSRCAFAGAWLDRRICGASGGAPAGWGSKAQNDGAAACAPAEVCCAPGHTTGLLQRGCSLSCCMVGKDVYPDWPFNWRPGM